ncbi:hypothetical protein ATCC90586_005212 [Pythium insidiosum]|nr:hypothetical protein ATCC90586_005212 [Pythium insidiosum]
MATWFYAHGLAVRTAERPGSGRLMFAVDALLDQQEDSATHTITWRSSGEFRMLHHDLSQATFPMLPEPHAHAPLPPRSRGRLRRDSWQAISRLFGARAAADSASLSCCRCTQGRCPFRRLYDVLQSCSLSDKAAAMASDAITRELTRIESETFLLHLQRFFSGYPRSFVERLAADGRCDVLRLLDEFFHSDTAEPTSRLTASDSALQRKRTITEWARQVVRSDGARLSRLAPVVDDSEPVRLSVDSAMEAVRPRKRGATLGRAESSSLPVAGSLPVLTIRAADVKTCEDALVELRDSLLQDASVDPTVLEHTPPAQRWELALHVACSRGNLSHVRAILRRGTDINAVAWDGTTPLHTACRSRRLEVAQVLLAHGADINQQDLVGMTALMCAINDGNADVVRFLLRSGADANAQTARGVTPLHFAVAARDATVVHLLLAHGAVVNDATAMNAKTPLHIAAEAGDYPVCELLLANGADPCLPCQTGQCAVDLAVEQGHWPVVGLFEHAARRRESVDCFLLDDHPRPSERLLLPPTPLSPLDRGPREHEEAMEIRVIVPSAYEVAPRDVALYAEEDGTTYAVM